VGHPGFEAEDIIGTLGGRAPGKVLIFSGDRDLFQLVEDPRCVVLYPIRGVSKLDFVDESYIENKYGIPGRAYRDYAVLRGDASDGLPGVKGIGEKLASSLVSKFGSLDKIVEAAEGEHQGLPLQKVNRELDYVKRAEHVVTIRTDVPIPEVDITRPRQIAAQKILSEARSYGLESPVRSLLKALAATG
jgi:5'-3' exonuclease